MLLCGVYARGPRDWERYLSQVWRTAIGKAHEQLFLFLSRLHVTSGSVGSGIACKTKPIYLKNIPVMLLTSSQHYAAYSAE